MKKTYILLCATIMSLLFLSCGNSNVNFSSSLSGIDEGKSVFDSTTIKMNVSPNKTLMPWKGTLTKAVQWVDKNGENTLIFSEKPAYVTAVTEEEERRTDFYAICYIKKDQVVTKLWEISDFVEHCWCDCEVRLQESTITIKDLNADGQAENLFIYTLNDRCDAGVVITKLMMHTGATKLAIRGYSQLYLGPTEEEMNEFLTGNGAKPVKYKDIDLAYDGQDKAFRVFASSYWDAYIEAENELFRKQQSE